MGDNTAMSSGLYKDSTSSRRNLFIFFLLIFFFGGEWADSFFPTAFYLIAGGVMVAVGIGLFVSYFTGKKLMAKEIEAEENNLLKQE